MPICQSIQRAAGISAMQRAARKPFRRNLLWIPAAVVLILAPLVPAYAQHASDDPVASAEDAFGLKLGREVLGIYSSGGIRGFDPQAAGNVRIEGLYFDQQGSLSDRVVEGSTVKIGVSEIGYAFPAPTGIVDYDLRNAGAGTPSGTLVVNAGPFQAYGVSVDANLPLLSKQLLLPIGASYQVSTQTATGASNPGYTSRIVSLGLTPLWKPNDWLTLRGIADWQRKTHAKTLPLIFTAGDFTPPETPKGYYGQDWAEGESQSENYGAIITARLARHWSLAAGIFHSIADNPVGYADLYVNTQPDGTAEQLVVASPDQRTSSTSGEARLTGQFGAGVWRHEVVLLARGRDTLALYGGSDVVDVGPGRIDQDVQVPKPMFVFSERTHDRARLLSAGVGYHAQWQGHGDFAFGIQRESYDKTVVSPNLPVAQLTDHPLRAYASGALALTSAITAYSGYTQGLEESGVAPSSAANRGAILPDARTWQVDAGIRYQLTPKVKLIAGVFEIQKPYFNFDTSNVDRELGLQRSKGLEASISGELMNNLNVTAGVLFGEVRILGPNLSAEGVGSYALGQARIQSVTDADYRFSSWPALSADIQIRTYGPAPASVDGIATNHAQALVHIGARYRFTVRGAPSTLRLQIRNVMNYYFWNLDVSPGFSQYSPRSVVAYLTTDF
jgi:iron complex outermembrane recepter protein